MLCKPEQDASRPSAPAVSGCELYEAETAPAMLRLRSSSASARSARPCTADLGGDPRWNRHPGVALARLPERIGAPQRFTVVGHECPRVVRRAEARTRRRPPRGGSRARSPPCERGPVVEPGEEMAVRVDHELLVQALDIDLTGRLRRLAPGHSRRLRTAPRARRSARSAASSDNRSRPRAMSAGLAWVDEERRIAGEHSLERSDPRRENGDVSWPWPRDPSGRIPPTVRRCRARLPAGRAPRQPAASATSARERRRRCSTSSIGDAGSQTAAPYGPWSPARTEPVLPPSHPSAQPVRMPPGAAGDSSAGVRNRHRGSRASCTTEGAPALPRLAHRAAEGRLPRT